MSAELPDHYGALGLPRDSSIAELRQRYLDLSRQHHPDKSKAEDARDIFQRVCEAWSVLSDPMKRREYDALLTHRSVAQHFPVDAEVDLDDMVYDEASGTFSRECRCSGHFIVSDEQLENGCDIVSCSTCTLSIRVLYEAAE